MKAQMFLATALLAGLFAVNASAIVMDTEIVRCTEPNNSEGGVTVTIDKHVVGLLPNPQITYTATLSEDTIAGPTKPKSYDVTPEQGPGLGAPQEYTGTNFDLSINVDGPPVKGALAGHIDAGNTVRDLRCKME